MGVAAFLREEMESLLNKYEVTAVFAGHHHDAQRTCAVYNQTCVASSSLAGRAINDEWSDDVEALDQQKDAPEFGTVHIVTGAAGQWNHVFLDPSPLPWLAFANTQVHGYHRVYTRGDEMTIEFVASADRRVWDSVTIVRGGKALGRAPRVRRNPSVTYQPELIET
jgi:hypothetical protein